MGGSGNQGGNRNRFRPGDAVQLMPDDGHATHGQTRCLPKPCRHLARCPARVIGQDKGWVVVEVDCCDGRKETATVEPCFLKALNKASSSRKKTSDNKSSQKDRDMSRSLQVDNIVVVKRKLTGGLASVGSVGVVRRAHGGKYVVDFQGCKADLYDHDRRDLRVMEFNVHSMVNFKDSSGRQHKLSITGVAPNGKIVVTTSARGRHGGGETKCIDADALSSGIKRASLKTQADADQQMLQNTLDTLTPFLGLAGKGMLAGKMDPEVRKEFQVVCQDRAMPRFQDFEDPLAVATISQIDGRDMVDVAVRMKCNALLKYILNGGYNVADNNTIFEAIQTGSFDCLKTIVTGRKGTYLSSYKEKGLDWRKAEIQGFTPLELATEFMHHPQSRAIKKFLEDCGCKPRRSTRPAKYGQSGNRSPREMRFQHGQSGNRSPREMRFESRRQTTVPKKKVLGNLMFRIAGKATVTLQGVPNDIKVRALLSMLERKTQGLVKAEDVYLMHLGKHLRGHKQLSLYDVESDDTIEVFIRALGGGGNPTGTSGVNTKGPKKATYTNNGSEGDGYYRPNYQGNTSAEKAPAHIKIVAQHWEGNDNCVNSVLNLNKDRFNYPIKFDPDQKAMIVKKRQRRRGRTTYVNDTNIWSSTYTMKRAVPVGIKQIWVKFTQPGEIEFNIEATCLSCRMQATSQTLKCDDITNSSTVCQEVPYTTTCCGDPKVKVETLEVFYEKT